jgi:hypothetical protein
LGLQAHLTRESLELAILWKLSKLLAEDVHARVSEVRWREALEPTENERGGSASVTDPEVPNPPTNSIPRRDLSPALLSTPVPPRIPSPVGSLESELTSEEEDGDEVDGGDVTRDRGEFAVGDDVPVSGGDSVGDVAVGGEGVAVGGDAAVSGVDVAVSRGGEDVAVGDVTDSGVGIGGVAVGGGGANGGGDANGGDGFGGVDAASVDGATAGQHVDGGATSGGERDEARRTTGGKSLEFLVPKTRKVTLKLKRKSDDDDFVTEDGEDDGDDEEFQMKVDEPSPSKEKSRPKKKRRISSAPTVNSGEDEPGSVVYVRKKGNGRGKKRRVTSYVDKEAMPIIPGWPVYESLRSCPPCEEDGWKCWSFIRRQRGRQRFACAVCHNRKIGCPFAEERAAGLARYRQQQEDEDMDTDEGQPEYTQSRRKRSKSKGRRQDKSEGEGEADERPKTVKKKGKAKPNDGGEKGKQKQKEKEKGEEKGKGKEKEKEKGKGKEKEKEKGKGKEKGNGPGYEVKREEDDQYFWQTSE